MDSPGGIHLRPFLDHYQAIERLLAPSRLLAGDCWPAGRPFTCVRRHSASLPSVACHLVLAHRNRRGRIVRGDSLFVVRSTNISAAEIKSLRGQGCGIPRFAECAKHGAPGVEVLRATLLLSQFAVIESASDVRSLAPAVAAAQDDISSQNFARSMFPPLTTQTILPVPHFPLRPAATAQAAAPSAIT